MNMPKAKNNFKVDFIGIGASRSGTTWVSKCLAEHPEICFSKKKETHFFGNRKYYKRGIKYYKKFFSRCSKNKIKGEFTPSYFSKPDVAKRIFKNFPEAKLIAVLRNPIERAYSEYFYNLAIKGINEPTFEQALSGPLKNKYLRRGKYYTNLKRFIKLFPKKNILILIYEDIEKNPLKFIQQIYDFLGVNPNYIPPSIDKKINTSPLNKKLLFFPFLNKIINFIRKKVKNKINSTIKKIIKRTKITKALDLTLKLNKKRLFTKKEPKPPMRQEIRERLYKYYKEEIKNLEKLINRDLSFWK